MKLLITKFVLEKLRGAVVVNVITRKMCANFNCMQLVCCVFIRLFFGFQQLAKIQFN